MFENIKIKYRTWYKGSAPRKIKLEIPGWAGDSMDHSDGSKPQPWHCQPFIDGSTYGLELIYPFDTECRITLDENNEIKFEGDFSKESPWTKQKHAKPFAAFAPGHFGFTSSIDICPPEGYVTRIEPHPRFFTDTTGTVPIPVPGHLHNWWPRIFFIVFKAPLKGQTFIFRKDEPYAQILIVPRKMLYNVVEMTKQEKNERLNLEGAILKYQSYLSENIWEDHKGNTFDDKYRQLSNAYAKNGMQGIKDLIRRAFLKSKNKETPTIKPIYLKYENHKGKKTKNKTRASSN